VTVYAITEHHQLHTCPAEQERHSIDIQRRIVHTRPARACQHPVTIRVGDTVTTVPCGRHEPALRQCGACRTLVTITQVTASDLGPAPLGLPPAPTGLAKDPCPACGQPVAAILTRHILCHTTPRTRGKA
jgi:hypothetical protein